MTQSALILNHLKEGKSITPLEALNLYGCFRLGARIWDLKEMGYEIETENVTENGKTFARYRIKDWSGKGVQTSFLDNNYSKAS